MLCAYELLGSVHTAETRLGLEQYEAAFRENAIDDTVLPNLTAEDLKDLGVRYRRAPPCGKGEVASSDRNIRSPVGLLLCSDHLSSTLRIFFGVKIVRASRRFPPLQ
jgi:SAM (Sterile alpha motif) domain-containing protein